MKTRLTIPEIQRIWAAIAWARSHGFDQSSMDDQYLERAELKLMHMFDLENVEADQ